MVWNRCKMQWPPKWLKCIKGNGLSFWPKPILHPIWPPTSENSIVINVRPCGFCNQGYHCWDIAMTSCKHTYHPFYLGEIIKLQNTCLVYDHLLHPDWWHSWGFGEEDDVKGSVDKLGLQEQHEEIKWSLKAKLALHFLVCNHVLNFFSSPLLSSIFAWLCP